MTDTIGEDRGNLLIIVARAPIVGTTKTRLGAAIGADRACALYRSFLTDLAERFSPDTCRRCGFDVTWGFTPPESDFRSVLQTLAPTVSLAKTQFIGQEGATFNDRLTNLFHEAFAQGYRRVAIMASDSPHLPREVAESAFAALTARDVVIGRVADGGYYLIGLSRFSRLLIDLPMSTSTAAEAVVNRARSWDLQVGEIAPSFDIDEAADLSPLRSALAPDGVAAPATWAMLHQLGLDLVAASSLAPSHNPPAPPS